MMDGCAVEPQWPGPAPVREKAGDASGGTDEESMADYRNTHS